MKTKNSLLKKQKKLLAQLSNIGPFMDGSLSTVNRICGNSNCRCRKDTTKKHPAMFLTWKENQKTQAVYVPVAMQKEAMLWNQNYKKLKKLIKEISSVQKKLLLLR